MANAMDKIFAKINSGAVLSNNEVLYGISILSPIVKSLAGSGAHFDMARTYAIRELTRLEDWRDARNLPKNQQLNQQEIAEAAAIIESGWEKVTG